MESRLRNNKKKRKQRRRWRTSIVFGLVMLAIIFAVVTLHSVNQVVKNDTLSKLDVIGANVETSNLDKVWQQTLKKQDAAPDVSIAVYDHRTNGLFTYHVGKEDNYYMASTVKVSVLANLLYQENNNNEQLTDDQDALATNMIENSDNDSTSDLVDEEGLSSLDDFWSTMGMNDTHTHDDAWGLTQTTAADQVKLLNEIFYNGDVLPSTSRNYIKKLMGNVNDSQNWGISSGLSGNASYELKNGWLQYGDDGQWIVNSIGHVKDGETDYTIAVYTYGSDSEDAGISEIDHLGAATYKYLTEHHD
ncbi:serine hydrolase [Weissella oryzae]|nr:serine hydrolase [Weissella oryzae]